MTDLTMSLYHQKNDFSMARYMFDNGRNTEAMPKPTKNIHPSKMDGEQLQANTGCLISLRLCNLAVEKGLQVQLLDKIKEILSENGMEEPSWEAMGKAINAHMNPFELV